MLDTVYLIDDDEISLLITGKVLERRQLARKIHRFSSAADALAALEANHDQPALLPQLILVDMRMPGMSGPDFIRAYHGLRSRLARSSRVIVLSSSVSLYDQNLVSQLGSDGYISKPLSEQHFGLLLDYPDPSLSGAVSNF